MPLVNGGKVPEREAKTRLENEMKALNVEFGKKSVAESKELNKELANDFVRVLSENSEQPQIDLAKARLETAIAEQVDKNPEGPTAKQIFKSLQIPEKIGAFTVKFKKGKIEVTQ